MYAQKLTVRFEDVDFARVVFFPKLFVYAHNVFEDFFANELGVPYVKMLAERKVGYPAVHADADFRKPLRFGDVIRVELSVLKVGTSSLHCRYRMFPEHGTELLAEVKVVSAAIAMDTFQSAPLPADVRAAFERHLER
ncbi:MAG: acyl-CoA thioesterase [Myxococcaceae bacterium]